MSEAKVGILTRISTPYRDPLFEKLCQETKFDIEVLYCMKEQYGRDWRINENKNFSHTFLKGGGLTIGKRENPFAINFNPGIWWKLSREEYDVLIIGGYADITMVIAIFWCWVHRKPYVMMGESHLLNKRGKLKKIMKEFTVRPIMSRSAAFLPTGSLSKKYMTYYGGEPSKMYFCPNTIDVGNFEKECRKYRQKKSEIKSSFNIKANKIILFVGRLVKVKGVKYLIQAFKQVGEEFEDTTLLIVGDGDLRDQLEYMVEKNAIENVIFQGFIPYEDLPKFYGISDIFALPSKRESWGVIINEAMAAGLPIVTTRKVGSGVDLVEDGKNGFIIEEESPAELYLALRKILQSDELMHKMGHESLRIIRNWDYSLCQESFNRAIHTALKGS